MPLPTIQQGNKMLIMSMDIYKSTIIVMTKVDNNFCFSVITTPVNWSLSLTQKSSMMTMPIL